MPTASSAPAMVAGILGAPGNHVVQIAIVIVVAAALIGYVVWRLGSSTRAVRGWAPPRYPVAGEQGNPTTDEATLRLARVWSGVALGGQSEAWDIVLDGRVVGTIADQETVEVGLAPGHHTLRLGRGRHTSPQRIFDVANAGMASYQCHGPRFWPLWVAAMIKSDLWITLRAD